MQTLPKILIYGYGNPGRQDDGLGNCFVERIQEWASLNQFDNIFFDSNYQLNIEDAAEIADKDIVVFVDASIEDIRDFLLDEITPKTKVEFSMHAVSASYVVQLCKDIYQKTPRAFLLHIKGYKWEFGEGLSSEAEKNLEKAIQFMIPKLESPAFFLENQATENSV